MKSPVISPSALALSMLLASGLTLSAATLTWTGSQANVDPETGSPTTTDGTKTGTGITDTTGWRNTTTVKTHDIDGDNIIGTDGYVGRGDTRFGSTGDFLPSYITGYTNIIGGGNNFGYVDDPSNPTNNDYRVGFWGQNNATADTTYDLFSFSVTGTGLDGKDLRLAIQYDCFGSAGNQQFILTQTAGGSGSVSSSMLFLDSGDYDWAFFTISGAQAGDSFKVSAYKPATGGAQAMQWTTAGFDTVVIPETSAVVLGLSGALLLLRRRRG